MMEYFGIIFSIRIYRVQQVKNEQLVNNFNEGLIDLGSTIDLRGTIVRKKITENENPNKIVNIVEKILNFNKPQKGKGIKILTRKQMFQRLPVALVEVTV